jgi:tetratricopeptide (TPR) repeat protein
MASVLAIISKAQFEKEHAGARVGQVLPIDRYRSTHASLEPLQDGGALFLVTVRPPHEALWLVAILETPKRHADGWRAQANTHPITDVSTITGELRFSTGAGIKAKKGALGMSLQTPRRLTDGDVRALRTAAGAAPSPPPPPAPAPASARDVKARKREAEALRADFKKGPKQEKAFAMYLALAKEVPDDADVWLRLGQIIDTAERNEEQYVKTRKLLALVGEGVTDQDFNQLTCWKKAVALRPDLVDAWKRLAKAYESMDAVDDATDANRRILALVPDNVDGWCRLAHQLHASAVQGEEYGSLTVASRERLDEAERCWEKGIAVDSKRAAKAHEAFYWLAEIALLRGDRETALRRFEDQVRATKHAYSKEQVAELKKQLRAPAPR